MKNLTDRINEALSIKNFRDHLGGSQKSDIAIPKRAPGAYNVVDFDAANKFTVYMDIDHNDYLYLHDPKECEPGVRRNKWSGKVYELDKIASYGVLVVARKNNDIKCCGAGIAGTMEAFNMSVMDSIKDALTNDGEIEICTANSGLLVLTDAIGVSNLNELSSFSSGNPQKVFNEIIKLVNSKTLKDKDAVIVIDLSAGRNKKVIYGGKAFDVYFYSQEDFVNIRYDAQHGFMEYPEYANEYRYSYRDFCRRYKIGVS